MEINCARRYYTSIMAGFSVLLTVSLSAGTASAASILNSCAAYCHGLSLRDGARKGNPHFASQSSAFQGNHRTHLTATPTPADCTVCHRPVTPADFGHQNGVIGMANSLNGYSTTTLRARYDKGVFFNQTSLPNLSGATCSNVDCHFEQKTPLWGSPAFVAPANCNACHGLPPAGTAAAPAGGLAGSHARHDAYFPGVTNCQKCHPNHTSFIHATSAGRPLKVQGFIRNPQGVLEAGASYSGAGVNYLPSKSAAPAFGTCTNVYCHGASMPGGDTTGTNRAPVWGSSTYLPATIGAGGAACKTCHGFPPPTASGHPALTTAVPATFGNGTVALGPSCNCHASVNSAGTTYANIFTDRTVHINGVVDAAAAHATPSYPGATHMGATGATDPATNCSSCHTTWNLAGPYPATPAGTAPSCRSCHIYGILRTVGTSSCYDCHGPSATDGRPNGNVFPNISGSHGKHVIGQGLACSVCHSNGGSGTVSHGSSNRVAHNSAYVNVTSPTRQFHFSWAGGSGKGTCSNVACHGPAEWGVTKFNCLTCHNVPIGARAAITGQFASQSHHVQGSELPLTTADCAKCHWEAKADGSTDTAYHSGTSGKGVSLIIWNGTTRPATPTAGTTYISYTANGSRQQIAKLNLHCMGCHSSKSIPAANMFGSYATDQYAPEQYLSTPKAKTSIQSRYSSTRTVAWSQYKYSSATGNVARFGTNNKAQITKALSAHGNAIRNQFPQYDTAPNGKGDDGYLNADSASATLGSNRNVFCFDCHNSHGSNAIGVTSSYSSATGRNKGGLLKTTESGKGGYSVTYTPQARTVKYRTYSTTTITQPTISSGGSFCNDCHNNDTRRVNIAKPWSITGTYSSSKAIVGYWSTPYFDNYTVYPAKRTPYKMGGTANTSNKDMRKPMGGHFGSSTGTQAGHAGEINGLCTPCHDPHGVSNALGANRDRGVPLLKGTWVTSPYREDKADKLVYRGGGSAYGGPGANKGAVPGYHIDQNTFMRTPAPAGTRPGATAANSVPSERNSQRFRSFSLNSSAQTGTNYPNLSPAVFAGLCIECHNQQSLTGSATATTSATWLSQQRVHQSVSGWASTNGTNVNNKVHAYTCAKCHTPHVSRLPRLLVTDCLDVRHFGQRISGGTIPATPSTTTTPGNIDQSVATSTAYGAGRFPGGGSRYSGGLVSSARNPGGWWFQTNGAAGATQPGGTSYATAKFGSNCHNATNAGGAAYDPTRQIWNKKSRW